MKPYEKIELEKNILCNEIMNIIQPHIQAFYSETGATIRSIVIHMGDITRHGGDKEFTASSIYINIQ